MDKQILVISYNLNKNQSKNVLRSLKSIVDALMNYFYIKYYILHKGMHELPYMLEPTRKSSNTQTFV